MGQLRVVEYQPVAHFLVEQGQIRKQQILVVINEAFLDASIRSLAMGIHFRRFGIRLPMHHFMR